MQTETGKLGLEKHKIQKGFGLVVVNEKFPALSESCNFATVVDKKNIKEFCESANIETDPDLQTNDLKRDEMKQLFNTISKKDFSSYDAFICFISSHGNKDGIAGTDGEFITKDDIIEPFKKCKTLEGKPKLFFIDSCRGEKEDTGDRQAKVVANYAHPSPPFEADILVAFSTVDGYLSYKTKGLGSEFITKLTKVLNKHAHSMNLTDMLTIVNNEVSKQRQTNGRKQMPSFTSTLRKAVYFDVPESIESPSSSQEP